MKFSNKISLAVVFILQIAAIGLGLFWQVQAQTEPPISPNPSPTPVTEVLTLFRRAEADKQALNEIFSHQEHSFTSILSGEVKSPMGGYALYEADSRLAVDDPIRQYFDPYTIEGFVKGQDTLYEQVYVSYEVYSYQEPAQAKLAMNYLSEIALAASQKSGQLFPLEHISSPLEHQSGLVFNETMPITRLTTARAITRTNSNDPLNLVVYWFVGVRGNDLVSIYVHGIKGDFAKESFEQVVAYASGSVTETPVITKIYLPIVVK